MNGTDSIPEPIPKRNINDPIRARIYAVTLFDLRLWIDENTSLQLRLKVKEKIVQVISDSPTVNDSLEDVVKWIELYLKFGERMKAIAEGNEGLGALIVIPPSLLTIRQWTKELIAVNFEEGIQHLQSIGVAEKADQAGAHVVANRIHSLLLQRFTSGVKNQHADHEELMPDEEAEEDSISEDVVEESGSLIPSNAASSCTSLSTLAQGCQQGQEPIYQAGIEDDDLMLTDERRHPCRLTPVFDGGQPNGLFSNLKSSTLS
ncbi:hypothetical protein MMC24_006559 [Lignoscripta atroalba]|nr:hypothetical protein [Lignoscripta atroalba]